ncbi:hypothetical protein AVHM3334_02050 [Acidovorax sp. SUPP3334]|nr:hypothetical protein AVHM3334_02050 [Acidovorax sp. SUPP3334]
MSIASAFAVDGDGDDGFGIPFIDALMAGRGA